jgi:spore coat protein H
MNSDRVKKICLSLSVILAMTLFFCLYMLNLNSDNKEDKSVQASVPEVITGAPLSSMRLRESKGIYNSYKPGEFSKIYINVFETRDKDGKVNSFSDFDLVADWDGDFNPVLDASVYFTEKEIKPHGQAISIPNAQVRVRGNAGAALKSYRIKFMEGIDGFKGQSVFNLNKSLNDPSRIANKLGHDLIIGLQNISGFRTSFLEVYIKDNSLDSEDPDFHSYGLYTHIEQPNKAYLKSRGLDENGSLYKAEDFSFKLSPQIKNVDSAEYDKRSFETVISIREGKDHIELIQMLEDLNDESKDFNEVFNTYFNEDNYLTWLSINILLGNADAMSSGFLLYSPSNSLGFYLLPWDFDGIFSWMEEESNVPSIYESLDGIVLHRKYLQMDGSIEKLKSKMEELKSDALSPEKVKSLIKQYKPILLEMMLQYPDNILSTISINEQIAYIEQMDEEIQINYHEFMKQYE